MSDFLAGLAVGLAISAIAIVLVVWWINRPTHVERLPDPDDEAGKTVREDKKPWVGDLVRGGDIILVVGMLIWLTVAVGPWYVGVALWALCWALNYFFFTNSKKWRRPGRSPYDASSKSERKQRNGFTI